nr:MAG TPA: hypothetical protein [Caudoviricetes sp.]
MLAEWTPARALVASVLDENLSRIEVWFSSWTLNRAINAVASVNYSLIQLHFLWPALNDHDRRALGGRFLRTYTRAGVGLWAFSGLPLN